MQGSHYYVLVPTNEGVALPQKLIRKVLAYRIERGWSPLLPLATLGACDEVVDNRVLGVFELRFEVV
jgi:hypothetical protein